MMRKVDLRMNELQKYKIIKSLVNNNGNKKRAALKIGCSLRTINRLITSYLQNGKSSFIHGNRGRKPFNTLNDETRRKILEIYYINEIDFNFSHFKDLLTNEYDINISYNSLYNLLTNEGFISPKAQRKTRKKKRNEIQNKLESSKRLTKNEEDLVVKNNILDPLSNHARIPRSKYPGELLQMDASNHLWFGDTKSHLHAAIDDSTGRIVGAYFDSQETLNGYYNVLKQILINYGIPAKILTDRRTIFEYKHKKNPKLENDTFTQFGFACKELGIELETTSVPEAKGRIERLFQTLQSRLLNELKFKNITSIKEANRYLKTFITKFNKQFSIPTNNITHVYESIDQISDINLLLSVITTRMFDKGSSISFKNNYYQAYDSNNNLVNFANKTSILVIESFDNKLYGLVNNQYYQLVILDKHQRQSKEFDCLVDNMKEKKQYIPPLTHPWKRNSFEQYLIKKAANINSYVSV